MTQPYTSLRLASVLPAALLAGCVSLGGEPLEFADLAKVSREPAPEVGAPFHILAGELAARRGLSEQAARHYLEAARLSGDAVIAGRAARLALSAGAVELAREAAELWSSSDPDAAAAYELLARMALREGQNEAAAEALRRFVDIHPRGVAGGMTDAAIVLAGETAEAEQALALMRQLVDAHPGQPESHYALALLALRLEHPDAALGAIEQALQMRPDWNEAQLLALRVYLMAADEARAGALIEGMHAAEPDNIELRMLIGRLLLDARAFGLAQAEFESILARRPEEANALYALGLLAIDRDEPARARGHFETLYRSGARRDDAAYYLGRIAEQARDWDAASLWYGRVGQGERAIDAGIRSAIVLARSDRMAAGRALLERMREEHVAEELRLFQAEGEILYQAGQFSAAVKLYERALVEYPEDPDLFYGRALAAERSGNFELAESDLRRMVGLNPEDSRALNALGYILSNHTDRYDEARGYIEAALAMTPDDAAVIDSMGWVEYRLGNLDTALRYLEQAHGKNDDPEIAAHLGEVLWVLGQRDRARAIWDAALQEAPDHPVLTETVRRLRGE